MRSPSLKFALQHAHRQRVEHPPLNGPLQRSGPIRWIIPFLHEEFLGPVGELNLDFAIGEPLHQPAQLDVDDLLHVLARQRMEHDDLVDAVEELRPEVLAQGLESPDAGRPRSARRSCRDFGDEVAADVRRHDHHGVLEVDRSSLAVGQAAVIQQLQHAR